MSMRRLLTQFLLMAGAGAVLAAGGGTFAKDKPASWKMIEDALFRVNDAPVKDWGVYQTGKRRDPLLIQMDKRFLLIRIHDRQVFEVDPARVQHKADELLWDPSDRPAQPLDITEWDASDTEAVFRIRAKIITEGRLLDVELPHQLDLSGMSPHPPAANRRQ
jgi:hypothetical protein